MDVPILRQGDTLIASVQSALSDLELMELQGRVSRMVGEMRVKGVIIDVTVMDVLDSFSVRVLRTIAEVIALRGARAVIVGIQPDVAVAMVRLGLTLENVRTALDLDDGLALLEAESEEREDGWMGSKPPSARTA